MAAQRRRSVFDRMLILMNSDGISYLNLICFRFNKEQFDMEEPKLQNLAKVIFTNDDYSFGNFLKAFYEKGQFSNGPVSLRCRKAPVTHNLGSKLKKVELEFTPAEGIYTATWKSHEIYLKLERGSDVLLTTQCRQIDFLKNLSIYGEDIKVVREYVSHILEDVEDDTGKITIYENNNGYWNVSKEKKPRKIESVILKEQLVASVVTDVQEFIESESWYEEMGIPYKRSYLLYGPPGTGKSSFAQALAGYIGFSICFVNCSDKVNDFQFNSLLNRAPKKSIILIEDVDAIFSERKNTQKNNALTFSGFLNALDGVRSQEGRVIVMTTNFKQRLDPALLRPGRVDQMFEISYASKFQMEKLCYRFFKNQALAKQFAEKLPEFKFSMSMIQGYLLKYRKTPEDTLKCISEILESDENVKMEKYLEEINCLEVLNDFKIQQCYSLASARNLPKEILQKMISKLSALKKGRLLETLRQDRSLYLKSHQVLQAFVDDSFKDQALQRALKDYIRNHHEVKTLYQVRDKAKQLEQQSSQQMKTY